MGVEPERPESVRSGPRVARRDTSAVAFFLCFRSASSPLKFPSRRPTKPTESSCRTWSRIRLLLAFRSRNNALVSEDRQVESTPDWLADRSGERLNDDPLPPWL